MKINILVTPFALSNVEDKSTLTIAIDAAILALPGSSFLGFHPFANDKSFFVTVDKFKHYFTAESISYETIDTKALATAAATPAPAAAKTNGTAAASSSTVNDGSKVVQIGIEAKKDENFPAWYQQVLLRAEMLDYYDISGCYIIRPWAYKIWKEVQSGCFF